MAKNIILSHDLGTSGDKASLYDENGKLLASTYFPYDAFYPQPGWVEQDPDSWWGAICQSTKKVIEEAGIANTQIAGISFSGQMMTLLPVSKDGKILMDRVIIWADSRSTEEGKFIEDTIGWEKFYRITGAGMAVPLYAIAKILWIKKHLPDVYKNTYKLLGIKDAMVQKLTGNFCTDFSEASNNGLFDIKKRCWSREIIDAIGLDYDKLPEKINHSTDVVGYVTAAAAAQTGLAEGTPVVIGGGDVSCAALGAGVVSEGNAYNCLGTASWFAVAVSDPMFDNLMRPFTLCHVIPDTYVVQLAMFSAGVAHEWVKINLCDAEAMLSKETGKGVYDQYDSKASKVPAGSNGLIFLPNMLPGGAPHNNLDDRGAFVGLKLSNTKDDMLRSVLEGVSFNIRLMCEAIEKQTGLNFEYVNFIGGGAKSVLWSNIQANILGKELRTLELQQEANSLGAAILAGIGLGIFSDFNTAAKEFIKVKDVYVPSAAETAVYNEIYPIFSEVYDALVPVNSKLKSFDGRKSE